MLQGFFLNVHRFVYRLSYCTVHALSFQTYNGQYKKNLFRWNSMQPSGNVNNSWDQLCYQGKTHFTTGYILILSQLYIGNI